MRKSVITTIGGAARDIMFYTNEAVLIDNKHDLLRQKLIGVEYGAKIYSEKIFLTYGGGGMNTAVNLAGLGIKTRTILSLGDDFVSQDIIKYLRKRSIDTTLVKRQKNIYTGTSFILNTHSYNDRVIFVSRGANNQLKLDARLVKKINSQWVYLTALAVGWQNSLNILFEYCRKNKIKIAWNPGATELKAGLKKLAPYMKNTQVFIVNRDEALELVISSQGRKIKDNIDFLLKTLHACGQSLTVITDGKHGAYLYDGQKKYFRSALKRKALNTTGTGDAFGSSLVAGIIKYKGDLEKSLKLAIVNSNSVIMKIGAQEGLLGARDLKKYKL
ncbi:MAG: PfkB family carbohydrate kinase [Patescibacteria group bacterium]|nr:PfkB family carbohydrate kinase [Patescibacteria group bacterium]